MKNQNNRKNKEKHRVNQKKGAVGGEKGTGHVIKRINRVRKWPTQETEKTNEAEAACGRKPTGMSQCGSRAFQMSIHSHECCSSR